MVSNSARSDLEAARPLFAALAIAMLGNGLLGTIVGIRAKLEQFPTAVTGLVMSSYYVGFLTGCAMAPRLLRRWGHVRVFLILSLVSALFALAYPTYTSPAIWAVFRFATGAATAGIYVVCESWLAGAGHPKTRGRLLAVYLLVGNAGYGLGQLLLGTGSPQNFVLFGVAAALIGLAGLPLLAVKPEGPPKTNVAKLRVSELVTTAPLGAATSFVTGVGIGGILGFGAVYGTEVGMSVGRVGLLMGVAMAGGIVLQWPIGALSDRINRRIVIVGSALLAGAFALAAASLDPLSDPILACMFGFTAFSFPMYSLAISHVNDALHPEKVIPASAALLGIYGVGTLIGPIGTSLVIEAIGPRGFWLLAGGAHAALGLYGLYRLVKRRRQLEAHHLPPLPINASPQAALLIEDTAEMPSIQR
jgi:MFS family permease